MNAQHPGHEDRGTESAGLLNIRDYQSDHALDMTRPRPRLGRRRGGRSAVRPVGRTALIDAAIGVASRHLRDVLACKHLTPDRMRQAAVEFRREAVRFDAVACEVDRLTGLLVERSWDERDEGAA